MYTLTYSFNADEGLTLSPVLYRPTGVTATGALILNQFALNDWYAWTMAIPSSFQGFLGFWDGSRTYALFAVNPQEGENLDIRVSMAGSGRGMTPTQISVRTTGGTPVVGASVWITSDPSGQFIIAGTLQTDDTGSVIFSLDPGNYYLWRSHPTIQFVNPQPLEV